MLPLLMPFLIALHAPQDQQGEGETPAAALLQPVVVTGTRAEARLEEVPQRIEVVLAKEMAQVPGKDLTDLLKRTTSVDVVQYPGVLSGVGIRGFRPDAMGGINKRTLLLVDGRPALCSNLGMMTLGQVERVEVLKGPGSALYGASAMGGVINLITRRSQGPRQGQVGMGLGSFGQKTMKAHLGGAINDTLHFDYAGSWQAQGNFTMGNGVVRPHTGFEILAQAFRLGAELHPNWSLDIKGDMFRGMDIATPGDLASGRNSNKDLWRLGSETRLTGRLGKHSLMVNVFAGKEEADHFKPLGAGGFQKSYASQIISWGSQCQNVYAFSDAWTFTGGLDLQRDKVCAQSWTEAGVQQASSADSERGILGVSGEAVWEINGGHSRLNWGLRHDHITVETRSTPFLVGDFTPSIHHFYSTSPSFGFQQHVGAGFKLHGTVGRGYITPSAQELTGRWDRPLQGGGRDLTYGNPRLKPESSWTYDLGLGWSNERASVDCTVFDTKVKDKITRRMVMEGQNRVTTYVNAEAAMGGIEVDVQAQLLQSLRFALGGTHYLKTEERMDGSATTIQNVPRETLRASLTFEYSQWETRLGWRCVGRSKDADWAGGTAGELNIPGFSTLDGSVQWHLHKRHTWQVKVENLSNQFYWEKFGYPQAGRNFAVDYRFKF